MKTFMEILFGPNRLQKAKILLLLDGRSLYVSQIAQELKIDQSTATSHMQTLEEAGLVVSEKYGPLKIYKLTKTAENEIVPILKALMKTPDASGSNPNL